MTQPLEPLLPKEYLDSFNNPNNQNTSKSNLTKENVNSPNLENPQNQEDPNDPKRHRRSKNELDGRVYQCKCGKSYLSQPALNNHIKTKHPELSENNEKRGRGRPRKLPRDTSSEFENDKYDNFFNVQNRNKEPDKEVDINIIITNTYNSIFKGQYTQNLLNKTESFKDNIILKKLSENAEISIKEKNSKTCDDIFYEYLHQFIFKCNEIFGTLLVKFIILFRECFNKNKFDNSKDKGIMEDGRNKEFSSESLPENLPELSNEFYTSFMENNNFFDMDETEKKELIELIQHFCSWLFKNEYTKSRLTLA